MNRLKFLSTVDRTPRQPLSARDLNRQTAVYLSGMNHKAADFYNRPADVLPATPGTIADMNKQAADYYRMRSGNNRY